MQPITIPANAMQTDDSGILFIQSQEDPTGPMLTLQPDAGVQFP